MEDRAVEIKKSMSPTSASKAIDSQISKESGQLDKALKEIETNVEKDLANATTPEEIKKIKAEGIAQINRLESMALS